MRRIAAGTLALILCGTTPQASTNVGVSKWVSGFYVGWMSSSYPPSAIDFSSLTHVMVFSVLPHTDGTLDKTLFIDATNGPKVAQDVAARAHAAGKQAILTVGGAGTAAGFEGATSAHMTTFVQNLVQTVTAWGYDGIDIDWEPLPASDYPLLLSLISNLRTAKPGMIVTADIGWLNINFPLSTSDAEFYVQLAGAVDQMNMMNYGMADNWGGWVVWHSSALYNDGSNHPSSVRSSAQMYINAGVPAAKLGMGIGFFGSCWNAPATAPLQAPGSAHVVASDNTMSFANIKNQYYSEFSYRYDAVAEAPYLSSTTPSGPAGCTFVSYEDETSVAAKANYARQAGLGGTIIWQLNEGYNPSAADPSSLLHAVGRAFLPTTGTTLTLAPIAGSPQSTPETSPFPTTLQAQVRDETGNPVAGITVTFAAPASGAAATFGGLSIATVLTDSSGVATAPVAVANARNGSYAVTATLDGGASPTTYSLTNTLVTPWTTTATAGTPQSAMVNKNFTVALRATVTDAYANPVAGVPVTFRAPTWGATAAFSGSASVTVMTDASGLAIAPTLTANGTAGSYSMIASAEDALVPAVFSLTNITHGRRK
jgi:chitinase